MTALVLLADDSEDVLDAHGEILADAGYRTAYARDGREAVALALELRPDVILMDLQMPGKSATLLLDEVARALARRTPFGAVVAPVHDEGSGANGTPRR